MGAWVRYIQNKDKKTIELMNQKYIFPRRKWIFINYAQLLSRLYSYPDVFEVADFDIGMISDIDNMSWENNIYF
jgi:hypothetical protein